MSAPRFSIIVPTCGRRTLVRALASALLQVTTGDEILVVGDGPQPHAQGVAATCGLRYLETPALHGWGGPQRTLGIAAATGDVLLFLDDDDRYAAGALAHLRTVCAAHPGRLVLGRFVTREGRVLWADPVVRCGNVSTQCIAVPNQTDRLGTWTARYEGDYDFIASTVARLEAAGISDPVVWDPIVVQLAGAH